MKAARHYKYGPPSVVSIENIAQPIPKENEVLIEIHASTVNRTESGFRSAEYIISRFWSGLFKPKFNTLGCEYAGIVIEIGSHVSTLKVGDKVFGYNDHSFGGHAEYLCIAESDTIGLMPEHLTFAQSAALTEGSHYALSIIKAANVKSGQKVLVNGATGAIGSAAVQILKHFGADITAVCGTKNIELIRSLGIKNVIDYEKEDFTMLDTSFDFVFDAVGKSSFKKCKKIIKNNGIYISTELGKYGANVFLALTTKIIGNKKVLFPIPTLTKEEFLEIKNLADKKLFTPIIDRTFNLDQIVAAYQYVELGQKVGNVILSVKIN